MPRPLADDAGFFYVIQLDPLNDPTAVKVGWSNNVELRVTQHRRVRKRPGAVIFKAWPARFSWEGLIIRHVRQCGFRRLRGEEYIADNPAALATAIDAFLEGWEYVPPPAPRPPVRAEFATGDEPMIDTQQLSGRIGYPQNDLVASGESRRNSESLGVPSRARQEAASPLPAV